ncbi:MAG: NADH-quinone oxidoreductase subunit C [Candidatus Hydrogenedentota bacterium]
MTRDEVINGLRERFGAHIKELHGKSPKRLYVDIRGEGLIPMAEYLFRTLEARFNIASGMDAREHFEVLYHFTLEDLNLVISLRVKAPKEKPVLDSLVSSFPAANWIEREMNELLGIEFLGHPRMRRLLLPEDWPEGVHPLRQDYTEWDPRAVRDRGV